MSITGSYDETIDYLRTYTAQDWLSLTVVLNWANAVTGAGSTIAQVVEMTLRMAAELLADGARAGDLVAGEPGFAPWPGEPNDQLERIRAELAVFVAQDDIPVDFEICWFHKIER